MKKNLAYNLIAIFVLFCTVTTYAQLNIQNTYVDAVKLGELYQQAQTKNVDDREINDAVQAIIDKYKSTPDFFKRNPFIPHYYYTVKEHADFLIKGQKSNNIKNKPDAVAESKTTKQPAFGTNWQSAVITGTSDFMAERFSAEVMRMGLDKAFKDLSTNQFTIKYFPKTIAFIHKLTENKTVYSADITILKQIIVTEIKTLPKVIIDNKTFPSIQDELSIGYTLVKGIEDGNNILMIIESISELKLSDTKLSDAIKTMNFFSNAFLNTTSQTQLWINPVQIEYSNGNNDQIVARYFYGLLYEQLIQSTIFKPKIQQLNAEQFVTEIQNLGTFVTHLNHAYTTIKNKNLVIEKPEDIIVYAKGLISGIKTFASSNALKSYVVINTAKLENIEEYINIVEPFLEEDYQRGVLLIIVKLSENEKLDDLRSLNFLVEVSKIEEAEDMKNLLEAYALPIGSSSIKRNSSFNVSLNGYVGFTGGAEKAYGEVEDQTKTNIGLTAPIGIAITVDKNWTLFGSVIDLGSIVNVRLNNNTTQFDNLRFEHFLAPGVGLYYNFTNYPLTLGFHYNYIPNLRNIEYTVDGVAVTETNVSVSRLNFSILIDIPLFTLFHKERGEVKPAPANN